MKDVSQDNAASKTLSIGTPYFIAPEIIKGKRYK
jgi:serine/threonine protein kinase